ncbi:MAG: hypothetical protein MUF07_12810 [Steroidobacteraceae bacterium]|jgi:hypothetical protein|nr:hypothetical protein [Steroidobacteraceae bacterium]
MSVMQPTIGSWYRFTGGDVFEIVALDEDDGTIELQYYDGTIEEMEIDDWYGRCELREIEVAAPPEDWTGSVDVDPTEDDASSDGSWRSLNG